MIKKESIAAILLYFSVIFIIILPLLPPGYILTLDILATEKIILPNLTSINFVFTGILYLLNFLIPSYILQKMILFLILLLSGLGMYRIISKEKYWTAKMFAGLIYMVNPFIYERLISGQWSFALGYAFFPWIAKMTTDFFQTPSNINIILLALETAIMASLSSHFLIIYCIFLFIFLIVTLVSGFYENIKTAKAFIKLLLLSIILNLNWIIGMILPIGGIDNSSSAINRGDLISFQSVADNTFGLVFNLLSGYGFWGEANNYFISPKSIFSFWPVITILLIAISLYGYYVLVIKRKQIVLGITLGVFFLTALDLAIGIASKNFEQTVFFLYEKIFFLRVFREPQKLVAVVIFCYAFLGGIGLSELIDKAKHRLKYLVILIFLILPFIYAPPILGGFWGQLKPAFYPKSWREVNTFLNNDKDNFSVLFFPWHQYMRFGFNNNIVIANPAPYFFDKPVISSRNYETVSLYTHDIRTEALHIEGLLTIERERVNLLDDKVEEKISWGQNLSPINVKYIILAKEDDYKDYLFLYTTKELKKIFESDEIILFQNSKWGMQEEEPVIDNSDQDL